MASIQIDLGKVQAMLEWLKTKLYLDSLAPNAQRRSVQRGQVYRCNLGMGIGSEMQKERPCVIVQNDIANRKSPNVIIVPITHDLSTLPCMAPIVPQVDSNGNTILDGQANASNIFCVSKARLGNLVCTLTPADMRKVDEAVAKSIELMPYYADLTQKLNDKLAYIERIKADRNSAQDKLKEISAVLDTEENLETAIEAIKKIYAQTT